MESNFAIMKILDDPGGLFGSKSTVFRYFGLFGVNEQTQGHEN